MSVTIWIIIGICSLAFLGGFIYLVRALLMQRRMLNNPKRQDALVLLRRRYDDGEITRDQFDSERGRWD